MWHQRMVGLVWLALVGTTVADDCSDVCHRRGLAACDNVFCDPTSNMCQGLQMTVCANGVPVISPGFSQNKLSCWYAGILLSESPPSDSICRAVHAFVIPSLDAFPFGLQEADEAIIGGQKKSAEIEILYRELTKLRSTAKGELRKLPCFSLWRFSFDTMMTVMVNNPGSRSIWSAHNRSLVAGHHRLFAVASLYPVWKAYQEFVNVGDIPLPRMGDMDRIAAKWWRVGFRTRPQQLNRMGLELVQTIPKNGEGISALSFAALATVHAKCLEFLQTAIEVLKGCVGDLCDVRQNVCTNIAPPLIEFYRYEVMRGSEILPEKERQSLIIFAQSCMHFLPNNVRTGVLPMFLIRSTNALLRLPNYPLFSLEIDQTRRGDIVNAVFAHISHLPKTAFVYPERFAVRYRGVPATGEGPTKQAIAWFFAELVDYRLPEPVVETPPDHRTKRLKTEDLPLFEFTDERNEFIRPVAARSDSASMKLFRAVGRMIGIAIHHDMRIGIPFSLGFWYLVKHLPFITNFTSEFARKELAELAIGYLEMDDPRKYAVLTNRNPECPIEYLFGMDFSMSNRVLDEHNTEMYLQDQAVFGTMMSIVVPTKAILAGIYDVLPAHQLSYLSLDELRALGRIPGGNVIDVTEFKLSTTYQFAYSLADRDPLTNREVVWFWEIVESELGQPGLEKLLAFVSSSRLPPLKGFRGADGTGTWMKLMINPDAVRDFHGNTEDQPLKSATCFKHLKMGTFSSKEKMKEILINSINVEFMDNL